MAIYGKATSVSLDSGSVEEADLRKVQVMVHARAICGACWSSPSTVPSMITLCHSVFICNSNIRTSLPI